MTCQKLYDSHLDMPLPSKSIYWREIPKDASVEETRIAFIVRVPGKRAAVAYWMGNEAAEAQRSLSVRASKSKVILKTTKKAAGRR